MSSLDDDPNELETVAALTRQTMTPHPLDPGKVYAVATADGEVERIDLTGDEWLDAPRRKKGTATVTDTHSFLHYYRKHADTDSEVYATYEHRTITAVLDAHTDAAARFGRHRLQLTLQHTPAWLAWTAISGKPMTQAVFADFIEDHRLDIVEPPAADVLELAQTFHATLNATFSSAHIVKSGQRSLSWIESSTATAGRNGQMEIPDQLDLALAVFVGDEVTEAMTARLRYRIDNGALRLTLLLNEVDETVRAVFNHKIDVVEQAAKITIMRGSPC